MENEIKVSIICSVRDRENYIEECVDSILAQTLKDIEIILIDNGCIDNCPRIIDEYAKKDNRIVAIHNDRNSTYGMALNQAAKIAKGEYIGIVESDDFIEPLMYEKLFERAKKFDADICASNAIFYKNGEKKFWGYITPDIELNRTYTLDEYPKMLLQPWNMWAKIYKKELFQSIEFLEKITYIDFVFVAQAFAKAKKIAFTDKAFYNWRQDGDRSSSITLKTAKALLESCKALRFFMKEENLYDLYKEEMYYHTAIPLTTYYRNLNKREKKKIFKDLKVFYEELSNDEDFTYKYFKNDLKNHIQKILRGDFRATLYSFFETKKVFGLPLIEKRGNFGKIKTCFCNIPVLVETKTPNRDKLKFLGITLKDCGNSPDGSYKKRYFFDLYKEKYIATDKKCYLFGIQFRHKKNFPEEKSKIVNIFAKEWEILYSIWNTQGAVPEILQRLDLLSQSPCVWRNAGRYIWLMYIACLLETNQEEKARRVLLKYTKYHSCNDICRFLPVADFAYKNGITTLDIEKAHVIWKVFKRNNERKLFENYIKNKTIAVVGNNGCEINSGHGMEIDSHDIVIRFNNYPSFYQRDYGYKTNIWFHGIGAWCNDIRDNRNLSEFDIFLWYQDFAHDHVVFFKQLNTLYEAALNYPDILCCVPCSVRNLCWEKSGTISFPTSGGMLLTYLYQNLDKIKKIDIYGFAFLQEVPIMKHYYDENCRLEIDHDFNNEVAYLSNLYSNELKQRNSYGNIQERGQEECLKF